MQNTVKNRHTYGDWWSAIVHDDDTPLYWKEIFLKVTDVDKETTAEKEMHILTSVRACKTPATFDSNLQHREEKMYRERWTKANVDRGIPKTCAHYLHKLSKSVAVKARKRHKTQDRQERQRTYTHFGSIVRSWHQHNWTQKLQIGQNVRSWDVQSVYSLVCRLAGTTVGP